MHGRRHYLFSITLTIHPLTALPCLYFSAFFHQPSVQLSYKPPTTTSSTVLERKEKYSGHKKSSKHNVVKTSNLLRLLIWLKSIDPLELPALVD